MKPPYSIPTMTEIASLPPNGYSAVSTFSGCGGSSLGYRMAGFKVLWASEFVPAARETYLANASAETIVDDRDIREVEPEDILEATGKEVGELDLFDGSPPCASFSVAGSIEAGWGKVKEYSERKQRTDDLFFEYARLIEGVRPKVFVAENVSGLVKGTAKGYFLEILARLKACGYRVRAKLLDARWLGVPQTRQRLIFVGVRDDLGVDPAFPKPLGYSYSIRDAIPWIDGGEGPEPEPESWMTGTAVGREWHRIPIGKKSTKYFQLIRDNPRGPCGAITAEGRKFHAASVAHPFECRKYSIAELRRICGFPDDFKLTGTYAQRYERLGRAVPPPMMRAIAATIRDEVLAVIDERGRR